jgi:hypothetical protein
LGYKCADAVKSALRFPDITELLNGSQFGGRAFDVFHWRRRFRAIFENAGDLVSRAFRVEGLPAPVIVFWISEPLADGRVVSKADKQLVDKGPSGGPENVSIDAGGDLVICVQDDICAGCRHGRIMSPEILRHFTVAATA